jgi:hypothetical protein
VLAEWCLATSASKSASSSTALPSTSGASEACALGSSTRSDSRLVSTSCRTSV